MRVGVENDFVSYDVGPSPHVCVTNCDCLVPLSPTDMRTQVTILII